MPVSHEQRKRQQQAEDLQAQQEAKDKEALQQLEEGQEISQEQAGHLQPQIGNAALAALLAHAASASAAASGGITAAEEDVGEELVEVQDEEELVAEELNAPVYGGGGGSAGVPGAPAEPWDMGKLFGGDDDDAPAGSGSRGGRIRPSPIRPGALPIDEDTDDEDDVEAVPAEHLEAVIASLPAVPGRRTAPLWGDAVHRAVEAALGDAGAIARLSLAPEDLVRCGGPGSPLGRPLAIGRFLAVQADTPLARCLGRALSGGSATMLVPATGAAGATARLATLAVCAQVAESGATDGRAAVERASATDRAVALALALDAWPRTVLAARELARRHRLHAPEIAEHALGRPLAPGGVVGQELPARALGSRALASLIPASRPVDVPDLRAPPSDPVASDEATALVDTLLAELTGGRDPRAPPSDPVLDADALQPILDAASDIVNDLGRAQVEFAAVAVAANRVRPHAPVRHALVYGDRALRVLAREVLRAGEAIAALRGTARPGSTTRVAPMLQVLGDTVQGLDTLRAWLLGIVSAAALRPVPGAFSQLPPPPDAPRPPSKALDAEAIRRGGDRRTARAVLEAACSDAGAPGASLDDRVLSLILATACMEAGDRDAARDALYRAVGPTTNPSLDSWLQVAAGSILAGMLLSEGALDSARAVCTAVSKAATLRGHWVAVASASIDLAAIHQLSGNVEAAVQLLLSTTISLRQRGALAAANLSIARLSEMRAEHHADGASDRFAAAMHAARAGHQPGPDYPTTALHTAHRDSSPR